jgi:hypothetical protein
MLNIITFGLKPIYEKHQKFYDIICNFRNKLPRPQNTARKLADDELESQPFLSDMRYITVIDLSTHITTVTESDIDYFYNELNHFDYSFMLFPKYYKEIVKNINRFNPKAENKNFELVMIQQILDNPLRPIKPIDAIRFNLMWNYKPTSRIYIWILKRTEKGQHLRKHH